MKSNRLKALVLGAAALAMVGGIGVRPARAAVTTNVVIPIDIGFFVACAAPGVEDIVDMSGSVHLLASVTLDNSGGAHADFHSNWANASGVGETTGLRYRGVWTNNRSDNVKVGETATSISRINMVGLGTAGNLSVTVIQHTTVNANGTVTASFDKFVAECK
jgi:hypothetical protein